MNRKLYWGLAALITVIALGSFVFYHQWSEIQQLKKEVAASEKVDESNTQKQTPKATDVSDDVNKPPPPGETHETGHWDGDYWHKTAHTENGQPIPGKIHPLTPEQIAAWNNDPNIQKALKLLKAEKPGHPPHPHDALSSEEHQQLHTEIKKLADESEALIPDIETFLDDMKMKRYKSVEELQKQMMNIDRRLKSLKERRQSLKEE